MTNIAALQEDWAGASPPTAVSTSNSIVDNLSGGGTSAFSAAYTYNSQNGAQFVCSAASRIARCDHTGAGGWRSFPFAFESAPSGNVAIFVTEQASVKGCDLRLNTDRTLSLRDSGSVARWTSTTILSAGTVYWIAIRVDSAGNGGHRVKLYNGTSGALIEDSGAQTNAGFDKAAPDNMKIGPQASTTLTIWYGQLRGDDTTEPTPPVTSSPADASFTISHHSVVVATAPQGTVTLTQTAGTTAAGITESPTGTFTIEHPDPFTETMLFDLEDDTGTDTDTQVATVPAPGGDGPSKICVSTGPDVWV